MLNYTAYVTETHYMFMLLCGLAMFMVISIDLRKGLRDKHFNCLTIAFSIVNHENATANKNTIFWKETEM